MKWAKFSSHTARSTIYVSFGRGWVGGGRKKLTLASLTFHKIQQILGKLWRWHTKILSFHQVEILLDMVNSWIGDHMGIICVTKSGISVIILCRCISWILIDEDDELSVGEIRHLRMKALFRHISDLTQSMNVGDINVRTEHHTGNCHTLYE